MKTIAIMNLNGGVGKSTTALSLAKGFANMEKKVLVIDTDLQATTTDTINNVGAYWTEKERLSMADAIKTSNGELGSYEVSKKLVSNGSVDVIRNPDSYGLNLRLNIADVLLDESDDYGIINNAIMHTENENIDLIAATMDLGNIQLKIMSDPSGFYTERLKCALSNKHFEERGYDFVVFDTAPANDVVTNNVLFASDLVIIPMQSNRKSLRGMHATIDSMVLFNKRKHLNYDFKCLFNKVERIKSERQSIEFLSSETWTCSDGSTVPNEMADFFFKTHIRYQASPIRKASDYNKFVIDGDTGVGNDYKMLLKEIFDELSLPID